MGWRRYAASRRHQSRPTGNGDSGPISSGTKSAFQPSRLVRSGNEPTSTRSWPVTRRTPALRTRCANRPMSRTVIDGSTAARTTRLPCTTPCTGLLCALTCVTSRRDGSSSSNGRVVNSFWVDAGRNARWALTLATRPTPAMSTARPTTPAVECDSFRTSRRCRPASIALRCVCAAGSAAGSTAAGRAGACSLSAPGGRVPVTGAGRGEERAVDPGGDRCGRGRRTDRAAGAGAGRDDHPGRGGRERCGGRHDPDRRTGAEGDHA